MRKWLLFAVPAVLSANQAQATPAWELTTGVGGTIQPTATGYVLQDDSAYRYETALIQLQSTPAQGSIPYLETYAGSKGQADPSNPFLFGQAYAVYHYSFMVTGLQPGQTARVVVTGNARAGGEGNFIAYAGASVYDGTSTQNLAWYYTDYAGGFQRSGNPAYIDTQYAHSYTITMESYVLVKNQYYSDGSAWADPTIEFDPYSAPPPTGAQIVINYTPIDLPEPRVFGIALLAGGLVALGVLRSRTMRPSGKDAAPLLVFRPAPLAV